MAAQRHCGSNGAAAQQHSGTAAATEQRHGSTAKGGMKGMLLSMRQKGCSKEKISCLGMAHAVTCTQSVQVISGLRGSRREDAARRVARGQEKRPAKVPAFFFALLNCRDYLVLPG